jgi:putative endonuclease
MLARLTHSAIGLLDRLVQHTAAGKDIPAHQRRGRRGEEEAYFYLRKLGYVMVARNYRSPRRRGEIDLIGWERDVLCFIEVKTRTTRDVKPAEAAVDHDKQHDLRGVSREYLRHLRVAPTWRFDVVSVYYDQRSTKPHMELFKNAFPVS